MRYKSTDEMTCCLLRPWILFKILVGHVCTYCG
nr:MAG TPA: hypothetical protein [Caudoviricetes sp.]